MKIIKKFFRILTRSPYTLPICGLVSVISIVYSTYTAKDMLTGTRMYAWNEIQYSSVTQEEIYIPDQEVMEMPEDTDISVFTTDRVIDLPEAGATQQFSQENPDIVTEEEIEEQTSAPQAVQKPSQTTKPQTGTQKPVGTTKPPASTQKPAGTTGSATQPISAWNVTYKQAKNMVKANSAYDYEDLYWLSRIISAEAKGESFTGQIGVGTVVLNRVRSGQFPNTIKGVVFDKKYGTQFTPVANGSIYQEPTQSAVVAAKMCLDGYVLSNSVLYFLNPAISTSSWIQNNRTYAFRVGNHEFYH